MKETRLWIRVSEKEKAQLRALAKQRQLTISEMIRLMAGRELSEEQRRGNRLIQMMDEMKQRKGKDNED